ncbi:hypothetical protein SLS55_007357 [Diplodia seriata]|uniref:ER membrane protein complex subunit 1 n=1 Tax=Diplodia seriata TaxID=420778 RepID=A0ABR3CC10_9PEZI
MLLPRLLALAASLVPATLAVFADDAYHVDYHFALLGQPQQHATFFHQPRADTKASLLYTLSDKLVLGAVNPKDGSAVWRQPLASSSSSLDGFLRAGENQDIIISAVEGQVSAWDAADGKLAWSSAFNNAPVKDLEVLELADASATVSGVKDVVVLFGGSGSTVRRLDGQTGAVKWEFDDNSGDAPFQISTSATAIYSISLHSTMLGGLKLKVTSIDPVTGHKLDQYTLSSDNDIATTDDILFVGANTASPLLAWTDKTFKSLKVNTIGSKSVSTFNIENNSGEEIQKVVIHAPHSINSLPHFLVHYQTVDSHWAEVYHADYKAGSISKAYDLPKLAGKGAFSTSTTDANVYFTRITPEEVFVLSSASHGVLGRWPVKTPVIDDTVYPIHAVSEVAVRDGGASAVRTAVYLSSGTWDLLRNGDPTWSRPEVLAGALEAIWVDLPSEESLAQELEIETHQNVLAAYVHRIKRHLKDLEHLPEFLQTLPSRFLAQNAESDVFEKARRDVFGLNKPVVVATESGRFVAVSGGAIAWNHDILELPSGGKVEEVELSVNAKGQIAAIFPQLGRHVLLNATSGNLIRSVPLKLALELDTDDVADTAEESEVSYKISGGEIKGFWSSSDLAWRFAPAAGERIINVTPRPANDPVASIGKVLGDRRVLYKYLNPNLALVTAVAEPAGVLSVYLLDGVSGAILWQASHDGVDTSQTIASALSENWLTYSFTLGSLETPSKGHQLVVAEFYESTLPNDRGPFGAAANYSAIRPFAGVVGESAKPHVLSQTYHIPESISHMAVTQTAQGITSKWLLVTLPESKSIVGIPRQILDPRRPVGRDPTPEEAAEGLIRYSPTIEFNPVQYLNHKREVLGVKKVMTSPAVLESTSLVFGYGLDVFGTRVSPSFAFDILGKGFNRVQLMTTVAALFVGVLFVAPLVRRKQINARWQIT